MTKVEMAATIGIMFGIHDAAMVAEIEKLHVKALRLLLDKAVKIAVDVENEKQLLKAQHDKELRMLEERHAYEIRELRRRMR